MFSIPLPFIAGLVFALTLSRSLKGVEVPGTRRYFYAFLILYALQGIGIGLRFGYGVERLAPFLPVSAAAMAPLAYLAFLALAEGRPQRPWLHLLAPVAVGLAVAFLRDLVDILLLAVFCAYAIALYRLTLLGDASQAQAALQRVVPARRAARLTAGLMLFFGLSDAALAIYAGRFGNAEVPLVVGIMNLATLAAVVVYYFAPEFTRAPVRPGVSVEPAAAAVSAADRALLARITAALEDGRLYRDENLSLARLARKAGLPARDVSAVVNRVEGINVSQFVNIRRINEACRLLTQTDGPMSEIMFESGFGTKSNFNREFRRITGMSPKAWRAQAPLDTGEAATVQKQLGKA